MLARLLAVWVCLFALAAAPALAQEEILSFESRVQVQTDGTFLVTERIEVRAEGVQIRRGIFRDFPTVQRLPSGLVHRTTFDLVSVQRDGRDEPHHTELIEGGTRVYVGDANTFLQRGVYIYTLTYETRHQMRTFDTFDEVYWNATGNFWSFPIRRAVATIELPTGAQIGNTASFTGRFGEAGKPAQMRIVGPNTIRFSTGRTLGPREGLTVAVAFQKGLVAQPANADLKPLLDNAGLAAIGAGTLGVFGFMFVSWLRVGRDPERGVVFPRFEPPRGLSPAEISWVYFRGHKGGQAGKSFMAALMSLGVRDQLVIEEEGKTISLRRTEFGGANPKPQPWNRNPSADPSLPPEEQVLMRNLFARGDTLVFDRANGRHLMAATGAFQKSVRGALSGEYFKHNPGYTVVGAALAAISLFVFLATFPSTEIIVTGVLGHFIAGLVLGFTLSAAYARFTGAAPQIGLFTTLLYVVIAAAVLSGFYSFFHAPDAREFATAPVIQGTMLVALAMGFLITLFARLMFAPTPQGQALMDEIEGFRMYLSVAEAERMNMEGAPDFTVDLFEDYLPYAIGLGVEKPWSEALEGHLKDMTPQERSSYRPRYYHGGSFSPATVAASTAAIASTIGSAYAASMPRSSGSSGSSGGGGFSGGGGGGGGGGGW
ncbi:MAG: DUF2207 domain-containing protein [Devosiaceae bacterium]|nr:DUF2207 domain-containing protein [Devosiaceae bacterium MH13]